MCILLLLSKSYCGKGMIKQGCTLKGFRGGSGDLVSKAISTLIGGISNCKYSYLMLIVDTSPHGNIEVATTTHRHSVEFVVITAFLY